MGHESVVMTEKHKKREQLGLLRHGYRNVG